jgi:transposase InsO family protein
MGHLLLCWRHLGWNAASDNEGDEPALTTKGGEVQPDRRPLVPRPEPTNKLSAAERAAVLEVCNSEAFASLPPSQIVPKLADQGQYLASESSFYRILRTDGQQHHRGRAKPPVRRKPPASYKASTPCEVWTWDITWMPGPVAGMFFYLYLIVDIFSRKIVGWEVHERESADMAAVLIRQAVLAEGCTLRPLVLHADGVRKTARQQVAKSLLAQQDTKQRAGDGRGGVSIR